MRNQRVRFWVGALVATVLACSGDSAPANLSVNPPVVTRVDVTPAAASLIEGGSQQLTATVVDQNGSAIAGQGVSWVSSNTAVASVSSSGLVTANASGSANVSASVGGIGGSASITVTGLPSGNTIAISPSQTFQTINGWEGVGNIGEVPQPGECLPAAFQIYQAPVIDRLANELGLTRVRLHVRSGYESPVDYYDQYISGQITNAAWKATWYAPVNDNADPNVTDPTKFHWGWMDAQIDATVVPLMQKLQARGEKLYVNLNYVDFKQGRVKSFIQIKQPAEYAEFVAAAFTHIKQKYGFSPDALEILLEPQNAGDPNTSISGADLGAAVVAAGNRLAALGFRPDIIAPSDASMANSIVLYDAMIQTPGVFQYLKEFSYHRYQGVSVANLQAIAFRGQRDHVRTSMLEWNNTVNIETLIEDLTVGNVSAWEQFSMANCGLQTNPSGTGIYYQINQSNPLSPIITMTNNARDYRQIFNYVRPGAVRIGAVSGNAAVLLPVAFRNPNGKYVAVVRARSAATFSISGLPSGSYGVNYGVVQQYNVNSADAIVTAGGTANVSIPAKGVITLYQR
ncbi:MAG: Ig-like domain-containing protein [Gemmatimonadaceae bacterium]